MEEETTTSNSDFPKVLMKEDEKSLLDVARKAKEEYYSDYNEILDCDLMQYESESIPPFLTRRNRVSFFSKLSLAAKALRRLLPGRASKVSMRSAYELQQGMQYSLKPGGLNIEELTVIAAKTGFSLKKIIDDQSKPYILNIKQTHLFESEIDVQKVIESEKSIEQLIVSIEEREPVDVFVEGLLPESIELLDGLKQIARGYDSIPSDRIGQAKLKEFYLKGEKFIKKNVDQGQEKMSAILRYLVKKKAGELGGDNEIYTVGAAEKLFVDDRIMLRSAENKEWQGGGRQVIVDVNNLANTLNGKNTQPVDRQHLTIVYKEKMVLLREITEERKEAAIHHVLEEGVSRYRILVFGKTHDFAKNVEKHNGMRGDTVGLIVFD